MGDQENGFKDLRQKKVLGRMLRKVLITFIYKNRLWCSDETQWPITLEEFRGLNEQLIDKFPKIHASHQWQTIVVYYQAIVREVKALE